MQFSHEHVALLQKSNAMISMTHIGDPLENAIAERVNSILKTELISSSYEDIDKASISIARAITIYNYNAGIAASTIKHLNKFTNKKARK